MEAKETSPASVDSGQTPLEPPFYTELTAEQEEYLNELTEKARRLQLHKEQYWLLLTHYKKKRGKYKSEVTSPLFFMSAEGRTNPESELQYTLRAFFQGDLSRTPGIPHPRCTFRARYDWLDAALSFDETRMPPADCQEYEIWRGKLNPTSLSVIFASYYMGNPSSMFGHTLLKLNNDKHTGGYEILDYGVNYAAAVNTEEVNPVMLAVMGLLGGYEGLFSLFPYYIKIREYNDVDNRELWEYRLNFTEEEISRVMAHLWELRAAKFNYYFFNRNCSYQLLTLLEVGRPGMSVSDEFLYQVMPPDTVKVLGKAGAIESSQNRLSLVGKYKRRYELLSKSEVKELKAMVRGKEVDLSGKEVERKAILLDTSLDYMLIQKNKGSRRYDSTRHRAFLSERARIKEKINYELPDLPDSTDPLTSHESSRIFLTQATNQNSEMISSFSFNPAIHEINDRWIGFSPYSQLLFLSAKVDYNIDQDRAYLNRLAVLDIMSLSPYLKYNIRAPSWRFSAGWDHEPADRAEDIFNYGYIEAGGGLCLATHGLGVLDRLSFVTIARPRYERSPHFSEGFRVAGVVESGIYWRLTNWWSLRSWYEYRYYTDFTGSFERSGIYGETNFGFNKRFSVSMNGAYWLDETYRVEGGVKYYFQY